MMILKEYYTEKIINATGIEIQGRNRGGNRQLSMKFIALGFYIIKTMKDIVYLNINLICI